MEWNTDIDLTKRKLTSRLVVERVLARGWKIAGFKTNPAIFLVYVPGREKPIKIFSASPSQMSLPASKVADDKYITNQILAREDLPTPDELLFDVSLPLPEAELQAFLDKNKRVVVKPLDSGHGYGITVNVTTQTGVHSAIEEAQKSSKSTHVLLQEQVEGIDIRIVCINYEFVDAISRIPASVVGDGVHTVGELIELTNASENRGVNYSAKFNMIPLDKALEYLGDGKLKTVPAKNETIQVIGVSNVGMGGVRQNIKSDIPEFLKDYAVQAAKALELPVCGVDIIVKRLPKTNDTVNDLAPSIIEVNKCPALTMHDDPSASRKDELIDAYLDYLATY